jgi:hypothetical protein
MPGCISLATKTSNMADSESLSLDTSNEAGDDPLMDLTDEQLDKLIHQKMYILFLTIMSS